MVPHLTSIPELLAQNSLAPFPKLPNYSNSSQGSLLLRMLFNFQGALQCVPYSITPAALCQPLFLSGPAGQLSYITIPSLALSSDLKKSFPTFFFIPRKPFIYAVFRSRIFRFFNEDGQFSPFLKRLPVLILLKNKGFCAWYFLGFVNRHVRYL